MSIRPYRPPQFSGSVPRSLVYESRPVELWQEESTGGFVEIADRMICDRVEWRSDDVDRAYLRCILAEGQPPMTRPGGTTFRRDYLAAAQQQIDPNLRFRVMVTSTDRRGTKCLIQGYPAIDTLSWNSDVRDHGEGVSFELSGVMDAWRHDYWAQVVGRIVHGAFQGEGVVLERTEARLRELTAAPCVFNEGGRPNCSPYPLTVTLDLGTDGTISVPLYVFAAPGEKVQYAGPGSSKPVEYWSHGRALLYLLWVYGYYQYKVVSVDRPMELPTRWINTLISERILPAEPPDTLSYPPDAPPEALFARAMWSRPMSLETNNTSLFDALSIVCADCGAHFHVDYEVVRERDVQPRLSIWADGVDADLLTQGLAFPLTRGIPRSTLAKSDAVVMLQNRTPQARITRDWESVQNSFVIVGGRWLYEADFELVPGWLPLALLDDVLAEPNTLAEGAKNHWRPLGAGSTESAADVGVYKRSHDGHDAVRDVGRKWVLNETGWYFFDLYERIQGPNAEVFDEAAYAPFQPTDCNLADWTHDSTGELKWIAIQARDWALRPRPFGDLIRSTPIAHEEPPVCDISFDGGTTWQPETRLDILTTEAGIRFNADSPLDITPLDGSTQQPRNWWDDNMWYALIDGRFRVRVTATIEGDSLLIPRWQSAQTAAGWPVTRLRTTIIDRPNFQVVTQHDSQFLPAGLPGPHNVLRSDLEVADRYRTDLVNLFTDKLGAVQATEPYVDLDPGIGQRVIGITGIGVTLFRLLGSVWRAPQIGGVNYQLSGAQSTTPLIGDMRHVREELLV